MNGEQFIQVQQTQKKRRNENIQENDKDSKLLRK